MASKNLLIKSLISVNISNKLNINNSKFGKAEYKGVLNVSIKTIKAVKDIIKTIM